MYIKKQKNSVGIIGFVLSLISIFVFPLTFGTFGTLFSVFGANPSEYERTGLARAGLIIGIIGIIIGIGKGVLTGVWI